MVPRMVSFDLVFYNLSGKVTFVDFQQGEQGFWFLNRDSPSKNWNKMNHLKMLTVVSMETKVVSGHSFSDKFSEKFNWRTLKKGNRIFAEGMAKMPVISRQIGLRCARTSFDKKIPKTAMAHAHKRLSSLYLNLKSLVHWAHDRSCKLMSFRSGFSSKISPGPFMTKNSQIRTHRLFFRQCSNLSQAIQWKATGTPLRAE